MARYRAYHQVNTLHKRAVIFTTPQARVMSKSLRDRLVDKRLLEQGFIVHAAQHHVYGHRPSTQSSTSELNREVRK